jgi:hypothetical protein
MNTKKEKTDKVCQNDTSNKKSVPEVCQNDTDAEGCKQELCQSGTDDKKIVEVDVHGCEKILPISEDSELILAKKEFSRKTQMLIDKALTSAEKMNGAVLLKNSKHIKDLVEIGRKNLGMEGASTGGKMLIINVLRSTGEERRAQAIDI